MTAPGKCFPWPSSDPLVFLAPFASLPRSRPGAGTKRQDGRSAAGRAGPRGRCGASLSPGRRRLLQAGPGSRPHRALPGRSRTGGSGPCTPGHRAPPLSPPALRAADGAFSRRFPPGRGRKGRCRGARPYLHPLGLGAALGRLHLQPGGRAALQHGPGQRHGGARRAALGPVAAAAAGWRLCGGSGCSRRLPAALGAASPAARGSEAAVAGGRKAGGVGGHRTQGRERGARQGAPAENDGVCRAAAALFGRCWTAVLVTRWRWKKESACWKCKRESAAPADLLPKAEPGLWSVGDLWRGCVCWEQDK